MTFWQFVACVRGFFDRQMDRFSDSVSTGFYAAYYNNTKHAKSPSAVVEKVKSLGEQKIKKLTNSGTDADMDEEILLFQHREKRRMQYMNKKQQEAR